MSSDIFDYGGDDPACRPSGWWKTLDFLDTTRDAPEVDWIITNPPFDNKAVKFVQRALDLARQGVAMFMRLQWIDTIERYEAVFRDNSPTFLCPFVERVNLCQGRWDPDGSTATAYCWMVWLRYKLQRGYDTRVYWIPPGCRQALTRSTDRARFAAWSLPAMSSGVHIPPGPSAVADEKASASGVVSV